MEAKGKVGERREGKEERKEVELRRMVGDLIPIFIFEGEKKRG